MTLQPRSILVIDDEPDVYRDVATGLNARGIATQPRDRVRYAGTDQHATEQFRRDTADDVPIWDLVILDMHLRGSEMDGMDLLDLLWKSNAAWAVALFTGVPQHETETDRELAKKLFLHSNRLFPDSVRLQLFEKPRGQYDARLENILSFYEGAAAHKNVFRATSLGHEARFQGSKIRPLRAKQGLHALERILKGERLGTAGYEELKGEEPHPAANTSDARARKLVKQAGDIETVRARLLRKGIRVTPADLAEAADHVRRGTEPVPDTDLEKLWRTLPEELRQALPGLYDRLTPPEESSHDDDEIATMFAEFGNAGRNRIERPITRAPSADAAAEEDGAHSGGSPRGRAPHEFPYPLEEKARTGIAGWLRDCDTALRNVGLAAMADHLDDQIVRWAKREGEPWYRYPRDAEKGVKWVTTP